MTEPTLADRDLVQVALTTRDLDRARGFYRDMLGLTLLFEASGMLFFQLKNTRLMIGSAHTEPPGGSILYIDAPDLDMLAAALEKKGVVFTGPAETVQKTPTHSLKLRAFHDPDGNTLALMGMVAD